MAPTTYGAMRSEALVELDQVIVERVKRGLALLEKNGGPDWANQIDMKTLNLADGEHCVLGQLYGNYEYAVEDLFGDDTDGPARYGFDIDETGECDGNGVAQEYAQLQAAWERELTPRVSRG